MMTRIPAAKRYLAQHGWLKSYHLFSFAEYYDPMNLQFGTLRVFNDDTIDAYAGFADHGHENMEIVTIVHRGQLTHRDSMGNKEVIKAGEVQRMSAGTGVIHAEKNLGDEPVHLFQIWLLPDQRDIPPSYAQKDFSFLKKENGLTPLVSGQEREGALLMHTSATIYAGALNEGMTTSYTIEQGRGVFGYVEKGRVEVNGVVCEAGDQWRIYDEEALHVSAFTDASWVMIDVPYVA